MKSAVIYGLLITVLAMGGIVWLAAGDPIVPPAISPYITFPPDIDPAVLNATLATLRTTCIARCGTLTFANFGLVDVDDLPGIAPDTTYPACICRNRDDTLTRITLRVLRP